MKLFERKKDDDFCRWKVGWTRPDIVETACGAVFNRKGYIPHECPRCGIPVRAARRRWYHREAPMWAIWGVCLTMYGLVWGVLTLHQEVTPGNDHAHQCILALAILCWGLLFMNDAIHKEKIRYVRDYR